MNTSSLLQLRYKYFTNIIICQAYVLLNSAQDTKPYATGVTNRTHPPFYIRRRISSLVQLDFRKTLELGSKLWILKSNRVP